MVHSGSGGVMVTHWPEVELSGMAVQTEPSAHSPEVQTPFWQTSLPSLPPISVVRHSLSRQIVGSVSSMQAPS